MTNEIVKSSQLPIQEIMSIGKAFAESGMFPDTRQAAQAIVKIQAGQEMGIAPFAAMTGIHIIQGRPTVGAGLIASKIKASGKYDYTVKEHNDKICSIDFLQGPKVLGNSTFTIAEAQKAGTKNLDKFPKNMLFARAISNGVKWFCPDVFTGPVYTPEEMEGIHVQEGTAEVVTQPSNTITLNPEVITKEPAAPPMNEDDTAYRTATNDAELITQLIDNATKPGLLKTFYAVNMKFFKTNPELDERLRNKGLELKQKAA